MTRNPGTMRARSTTRRVGLSCALALTVWILGCRPKPAETRVLPLEGKIERIDLSSDTTGRVTVLYHSEKRGRDVVGVGEVTDSTEIMINGVAATLKDLRQGDRVRGEVSVEKKGEQRVQIALKIHVDRARPIDGG